MSLFGQDPRFAQFRNQLVWCAVGLIFTAIGATFLIWRGEKIKNAEIAAAVEERARAEAEAALAPEKNRRRLVEGLREETNDAIQSRDWPRLEDLSMKIIRLAPQDGDAWSKLGWAQGRKGDIHNAMAAYSRAISLDFVPAFNLYQRACLYRQLGNYEAAVRDMKEAHERDPLSVVISNLLMVFQIQAGQSDEVRAKVSGFEKSDFDSYASQYLLGAAALALNDGDSSKAVRFLARFQALTPPDAFYEMLRDPFFDPYRNNAELLKFFVVQ